MRNDGLIPMAKLNATISVTIGEPILPPGLTLTADCTVEDAVAIGQALLDIARRLNKDAMEPKVRLKVLLGDRASDAASDADLARMCGKNGIPPFRGGGGVWV